MEKSFHFAPHIEIEGKKIGNGYPVFIVAEIGVNHNGDLNVAKKMIDSSAECGVDCVKFQTFRAEEFMADRKMVYEYKVDGKKIRENMFAMFKRLEMPLDWYKNLFTYARSLGLIPLTSVADRKSVDMIENLGISAFKLSSEDLINLPLLEYVARKRKPLILSTGMTDETEIRDALTILKKYRARKTIFLHCVSLYPTPDETANLRRMLSLAEMVKGPIGYSDHTMGTEAAMGAVALGACIIEKHFTLDKKMAGPDHYLSADPPEMKKLVSGTRKMEKLLGREKLSPGPLEMEIRKKFRRSVVAAKDLPAGHVLNKKDLLLKRPGNGLRAREIPKLLGRKLKKVVQQNEQISLKILI